MAILIIDGQELSIADDVASDDKKLRQALTPSYPFMPNASICRKKTQDDKLCVEIVNSEAGTQQASPIAVLEKPQQSTPTQQADSTFRKNLQQEAEDNSVNELTPFSPAWYPLQSRAIGIVQGQYFPSASNLMQGILVLDDGTIAPTKFMASSLRFLKKSWISWKALSFGLFTPQPGKSLLSCTSLSEEPSYQKEKLTLNRTLNSDRIHSLQIWVSSLHSLPRD